MLDWQTTWSDMLQRLEKEGWQDWADRIRDQLHQRFVENPHGDCPAGRRPSNVCQSAMTGCFTVIAAKSL